ncbi:MAG: phosphate ABC transporter substrate-binding protein [Ignavibacteriaceae bacterium]|nr:phosphate ABC transporter substrate-binding protein [Ignavibacteriaceae bacterium]
MRKIQVILLFSVAALIFAGCSLRTTRSGILMIKGSETMKPLITELAAEFMRKNPGVSIYVDGGSSSEGIRELIEGEADICMASRPLEAKEVRALAEKTGMLGISTIIAKDEVFFYVNGSNRVSNLSFTQLKDILSGRITNWKEVGGPDLRITLYLRPSNSGTMAYVRKFVLDNQNYGSNAIIKPTNDEIIEGVAGDEGAIGFTGIQYGAESRISLLSVDKIFPSGFSPGSEGYPVTRYLHLYTISEPTGIHKDLITWIISPEGQKIVRELGYIPLWLKE